MRFATMTSRFVSLTGEGKRMEEQIKEVPNCLARKEWRCKVRDTVLQTNFKDVAFLLQLAV